MTMDAQELFNNIRYEGMERDLRRLAVNKKLDTLENIAIMPIKEVCALVLKHYEVISIEDECISLLPNEFMEEYRINIQCLAR